MSDDVIGVLANEEDGRTITVVAAARGSLTDLPVAVFRTLDDQRFIAAVDRELIGLVASQEDVEKIMADLAQVIATMVVGLEPLDDSWIYERLDN